MPIDYPRLVAGLGTVAAMAESQPGLAALQLLVELVHRSTGAAGATYTEYGATARVVVATGVMQFALGRPVAREVIDPAQPRAPQLLHVDELQSTMADPLRGRGIVALAGSGVQSHGRVRGAVHLFLAQAEPAEWAEIRDVLRIAAYAAQRAYPDTAVLASAVPALSEQEDRALFLAVAGHELRTPVTVLKGYAGMLADRWDELAEPDRQEAAVVMSQRANELARLVDRLLAASVGDGAAGALLRRVSFDPVTTLLSAVRDLPAELRHGLRLDLPRRLPPALGDPTALPSVVAELVANAVRYSLPAGVTPGALEQWAEVAPAGQIELQAGADEQTIVVRVCDRGVGIDPSQVERAFERFWRARPDGDSRGGVGLGLYLVRQLVERQNGWVSLRPREGGGTVAEVHLPRADGPLRHQAPRKA